MRIMRAKAWLSPNRYLLQTPGLLRMRRERPCRRTAADQRDEIAPVHRLTPKAKDHGPSIAGLGVASMAGIATKGERRFGPRFTAEPVSQSDVL